MGFKLVSRLRETPFLRLRYSNLILNLFSLMVDANIPDIALEPDKTVKKVRRQPKYQGLASDTTIPAVKTGISK